ncbi:hypothetical protein KC723_03160, partial [Candidatus Kaiserbacteria bacterium]|nr:hypothetical protein [Candidatus Kaiserbacteria bacterium]
TTSSFDWDGWIEDVLVAGSGLSEEWQRFLENKLRVIAMQLERENSVAVDAIVAGLVTKLHNSDEIGVEDVIEILEGGV